MLWTGMDVGKRPDNEMRGMMPALVRGTSAILAIVPVIGQIGRFAPRADLFNSFLPVVLSCLVLTLIAALLVRDRRAVLIALAGLAIGGAQLGHDLLATTRDGPRGAGSFTILTLSAYHANPAPHDLQIGRAHV